MNGNDFFFVFIHPPFALFKSDELISRYLYITYITKSPYHFSSVVYAAEPQPDALPRGAPPRGHVEPSVVPHHTHVVTQGYVLANVVV